MTLDSGLSSHTEFGLDECSEVLAKVAADLRPYALKVRVIVYPVLFQNSAEREPAGLKGFGWTQATHSRSTWRVLRTGLAPRQLGLRMPHSLSWVKVTNGRAIGGAWVCAPHRAAVSLSARVRRRSRAFSSYACWFARVGVV